MNGFKTVLRGYDKDEVKSYLDKVIKEYERLLSEVKLKDEKIEDLKANLEKYEKLESTLNRALFSAESAGDEIKRVARQEAEGLINEAKRNANRIVNDALLRAEKTEMEADMLRRNITIFKRKLKSIIEAQLDMVNDIEKVDF